MSGNKINPDQVCPECFRTMYIIETEFLGSGTKRNFVCPVCHPDDKYKPEAEKENNNVDK